MTKTKSTLIACAVTLTGALLAAPAQAGDQEALWNAYDAVHGSLAADSVAGVAEQARTIESLASTLAEAGEHDAELAAVAKAASELESTDLETARSGFEPLSEAMARYAVAAGLDVELYHCSMKEAYWLQPAGETIENPYYGSSMLACGAPAEGLEGS